MTNEITYPNQNLIVNNTPSLDVCTHSATGVTALSSGFQNAITSSDIHLQFLGTTAYADLQVVNDGGGVGHGVMALSDSDGYTIDITSKQINFRDNLGALQNNIISESNYLSINAIRPSAVLDSVGSAGLANQILGSGASGGSLLWADPAIITTPNLASVLAVATAGDAGDLPISNLSSLTLSDTTTIISSNSLQMGATPLIISADASGFLAVNTTPSALVSMTIKNYLPINVGGDVFYMPLFQVTI